MATKSSTSRSGGAPSSDTAITQAVLRVVTSQGLDRVTVREVANEASVAIGTVQHWFPTKDALVEAAFRAVVAGIRDRVDTIAFDGEVADDLCSALAELLPLDDRRLAEARVHLAFAARAAVTPALARLQDEVLGDVSRSVAMAFRRVTGADEADCVDAAAAALAVVDGLAMHAVSSGAADPEGLTRALRVATDALVETVSRSRRRSP